jgi:hypothetical protein
MTKINVPRAEVAALVGLPADSSDELLHKAMADLRAAHEAREAEAIAAAAEQQLVAEDRRIVAAAINAGKFSADRGKFWLDALARDRTGNRAIIASLASGLPTVKKVAADAELQQVHNAVLSRLGIPKTPQRVKAASGFGAQPGESLPAPYAQPDVPAPVVIQRGVDPADWTPRQAQDAMLRRLGRRFWPGTEPPPPGDVVYIPSPKDVSRFDESTGQWVEKTPYKEM